MDKVIDFGTEAEKLLKKKEDKKKLSESELLDRLSILSQYHTLSYYQTKQLEAEIDSLQRGLWDLHFSQPRQLEIQF